MENQRIQLTVMGISYSQLQSGAYALILAEVDGNYRIPVVIGTSEAQSIAIVMEGIKPPRPTTHDLFASFAHAYGIVLKEVFIYKFEDGIFHSELRFSDKQGREVLLDSRTSDAIAVAMRTKSPIYTTRAIMEETGFVMENSEEPTEPATEPEHQIPLENYAIEELEEMLARHIDNEEYEEAAKIKAIIQLKSKK